MSDEFFEPVEQEQSVEDGYRQRIAELESSNAMAAKTIEQLQQQLGTLRVDFTVVDQLYKELTAQHRKERGDRIRGEAQLSQTIQAKFIKELENARIGAAATHQQLTNLQQEHQEILEKFAKLRQGTSTVERSLTSANIDLEWLLTMVNAAFKLESIVGRPLSHTDIHNARSKTPVLPSKLTNGKIKNLF